MPHPPCSSALGKYAVSLTLLPRSSIRVSKTATQTVSRPLCEWPSAIKQKLHLECLLVVTCPPSAGRSCCSKGCQKAHGSPELRQSEQVCAARAQAAPPLHEQASQGHHHACAQAVGARLLAGGAAQRARGPALHLRRFERLPVQYQPLCATSCHGFQVCVVQDCFQGQALRGAPLAAPLHTEQLLRLCPSHAEHGTSCPLCWSAHGREDTLVAAIIEAASLSITHPPDLDHCTYAAHSDSADPKCSSAQHHEGPSKSPQAPEERHACFSLPSAYLCSRCSFVLPMKSLLLKNLGPCD